MVPNFALNEVILYTTQKPKSCCHDANFALSEMTLYTTQKPNSCHDGYSVVDGSTRGSHNDNL